MKIPSLLHYVWVGGKPLPRRFQRNLDTWRRYNPEMEIVRWDDSNIDLSETFVRRAYEQKAWAKLSDLVRLRAVYEQGGIYLDTDVEAVASFKPLRDLDCFFAYQSVRPGEDPVGNAAFGASPRHPFIGEIIGAFPDGETGVINDIGCGPEVVSKLLLQKGLPTEPAGAASVDGITVLPRRVFYPYHWTESFSRDCVTSETLGIHHWDMSWHRYDSSWMRRRLVDMLKTNPFMFGKARALYRTVAGSRSPT